MNPSTLSNEELDRLIHEKVMEECWHEYINSNRCQKCFNINVTEYDTDNPSYCTSWEDYGILLIKLKDNGQWIDFINNLGNKGEGFIFETPYSMVDIITEPRRGCEAIASYFVKEYFCKK